jgi:hypothetical protein
VVRVSLFVWLLPLDLTDMGGPTSSYATAGIAFRVSGALKPHHHDKVEIPLVGKHDITERSNFLGGYHSNSILTNFSHSIWVMESFCVFCLLNKFIIIDIGGLHQIWMDEF